MEALPTLGFDFYLASAPLLVLCVSSLITMLVTVSRFGHSKVIFPLQLSAFALALMSCGLTPATYRFLDDAYVADSVARFAHILILGLAFILTLLFQGSYLKERYFKGEISTLFQLSTLGMLVMTSSVDLVTIFVGLELSSIGIYTLVGYTHPQRMSQEGAIKYFILGSLATAFLLFGFAFLYISSGSLNLREITHRLTFVNDFWLKIGGAFTFFGFAFKMALMPFHMWAPDAYESAPTGMTAYMAVGVKIMVLTVILRFANGIDLFFEDWIVCLILLAGLSMIGGNIMALSQTSLKRMLAYSSIAHSGYMAVALCAIDNQGDLPYQAILFYLVGYSLTSILAFGTIMWLESSKTENIQIEDIKGLLKDHPLAALALSVAMFSFAGMPPTVGFFAKFFIFNSALQYGFYSLAIIGIAGSLISLFYYLRVIVSMCMYEPVQPSLLSAKTSYIYGFVLTGSCVAVLLLGTVFPQKAADLLRPVTSYFLKS